jgi:hypothetical protein
VTELVNCRAVVACQTRPLIWPTHRRG